jgi:hypothetical protein
MVREREPEAELGNAPHGFGHSGPGQGMTADMNINEPPATGGPLVKVGSVTASLALAGASPSVWDHTGPRLLATRRGTLTGLNRCKS